MCEQIWNTAMPYAIGFTAALLGGQLAITGITSPLWRKLGLPNTVRYGASQSMVLGLTECTLYVGSLLIWKPEFIAVWLGLKTVIKWRHWESDVAVPGATVASPPRWVLGRMAYNLFLLSNALVVAFAAIGWKLIEAASKPDWPQVIAILLGTALGSIALIVLAICSKDYPPLDETDPRLRRNSVVPQASPR